jgi:hypothetical protein
MKTIKFLFTLTLLMFLIAQTKQINAQDSTKKADAKTETTETKTITIPAGTEMMVHFDTAINTEEYPGGSLFQESLNIDLVVDGKLIAKKGTAVFGRVIE